MNVGHLDEPEQSGQFLAESIFGFLRNFFIQTSWLGIQGRAGIVVEAGDSQKEKSQNDE